MLDVTQLKGKEVIWIVAGGLMQLPAIREARHRGYAVLVTDGNKDCAAKDVADLVIPLDTYDEKGHAALARNLSALGIQFRAVLCPGADVGPTVSRIAELLCLRAVPYSVARRVRHKGFMRVYLGAWTGFQRPDFQFGLFVPDDFRLWDRYPCVVKPVTNCATRGITVVQKKEDLLPALVTAAQSNKSGECGAVVEELLSGPELALDFMVVNGEAIWVNGVQRLFRSHVPHTREPLFGIEGLIINPTEPPEEVKQIAQVAAQKLGVTEGPFKLDMIDDSRYGWCILECATRLSGGWDHMVLGPLVGKDITGLMLDYALGLPFDESKIQWNGKYAVSYVPYYPAGKINGWHSIKEAKKLFNIRDVFVRSETEVEDLRTCVARPVYIHACDTTPLRAFREAWMASRVIQPNYVR